MSKERIESAVFVNEKDAEVLCKQETIDLRIAYEGKFHEEFVPFHYGTFRSTEDRTAAEFYVDALKEALQKDEPTRYPNPFAFFGH